MRAPFTHLAFLCAAAASPLVAQQPVGEMKVTPVSDLRADWLSEGVVSPNGRFFVIRSYATNAFLGYDRVTKRWTSPRGAELGRLLRWSPNGRFLAFVRQREDQRGQYVWVLPVDTTTGLPNGTARRISTMPGLSPAWSPDSRRIAYVSNDSGRMRVVSVPFNGGDEQVLFDGPGGGGAVDWSADGKSVVANYAEPGKAPRRLRVIVETKRTESFPVVGQPRLWLSPDGTRYVDYDDATSRLLFTSPIDGRPLQTARLSPMMHLMGWSSPNEMWALEHVTPSTVQRVSMPSGEIRSITPVDSVVMSHVRYSPDGKQFAFVRNARGVAGLYVATDDGSNRRRIGNSTGIATIAWSPSSKQIAYVTLDPVAAVHVVDVASGTDRELVRVSKPAELAPRLRWRNDGLALRYITAPLGGPPVVREAREVSLDAKDRSLVKFDKPSPQAEAHFINDTLLLTRDRSGIKAVDLRSGAMRPLYTGAVRGRGEFGLSADGSWIVFAGDNGENMAPRILSLVSGETRMIPYALSGELADMSFHPDGRHIIASACTTCNGGVEKWDVVQIPTNGDPTRVLTASEPSYKDFGFPSVSPDGKSVIFGAEHSYNTRIVTLTIPKP